jgi:hypothetical protein
VSCLAAGQTTLALAAWLVATCWDCKVPVCTHEQSPACALASWCREMCCNWQAHAAPHLACQQRQLPHCCTTVELVA